MSKKGKVITASIISQSGMTECEFCLISYSLLITHYSSRPISLFHTSVLSDQLLITHYSLLITHYEGYRRLQQLLLLLRAVIPARPAGETRRGAEQ